MVRVSVEEIEILWWHALCEGDLHLVAITDGAGRVLYNHPLPYLDSG